METSMGDALIVTGLKTGTAPSIEDIEPIRNAVSIPILIGSGLSYNNLEILLPAVNGAIVGSSFKKDGKEGGSMFTSPAIDSNRLILSSPVGKY